MSRGSSNGRTAGCGPEGCKFDPCTRYQIMKRKEALVQKALGLAKTCSRCGKTKPLEDFSELDPKYNQLLGLNVCHCCYAIKRRLDMKQLQQVIKCAKKENRKYKVIK